MERIRREDTVVEAEKTEEETEEKEDIRPVGNEITHARRHARTVKVVHRKSNRHT